MMTGSQIKRAAHGDCDQPLGLRGLIPVAVVSLLALVVALFYAPRGFDFGFADMGHDGYVLKVATDLCDGSTLFKDVFTQYGIAGDRINCALLRLDDSLMTLKYAYAGVYAVSLGLLTYVTLRWAGTGWGWSIGLFAVLSAPFYRHGIMLSVHVLILPIAILTVAVLLQFGQRSKARWSLLAGALTGLVFLLKQNFGIYQLGAVFLAVVLIAWFAIDVRSMRSVLQSALSVLLGFIAIAGMGIMLVLLEGGLGDWWLQTIVLPQQFYVAQMPSDFASPTQRFVEGLNPNFASSVPRLFWVPADAFRDQPWWILLRAAAFLIGMIGLRSRQNRLPSIILVTLSVSALFVNYPSYNFMHQWWSLIPLLPLVPLAMRRRPFFVEGRSVSGQENFFADEVPSFKVEIFPGAFAESNSRVLLVWAVYIVTLVAALGTIVGQGTQFSLRSGNVSLSTVANALQTCHRMPAGTRLEGICTSPSMRRSLESLDRALATARSQYGSTGEASASVMSIETEEGVQGIARTLLPIAALNDNDSQYPATWQLPGLADIYPDAFAKAQENGWLLLDYGPVGLKREVPGFEKIGFQADIESYRSFGELSGWVIYAPERLVDQ